MSRLKRFLVLWMVFFVLSYGGATYILRQEIYIRQQEKAKALQAELLALQHENRRLQIAIENARSDEHVRRYAREHWGAIYPHENLYEE